VVRVTVASATRRVDVALPDAVPTAELVNDLARAVGLLDPATAHCGYRLVTTGGRELTGSIGLVDQGIGDGALLTVAPRIIDPPRLYDDLAEAMADVVERDIDPWHAGAGRRVALTTATVLSVLGALAMVIDGSFGAGVAAGGAALGLVTGAVVVARVARDPGSAVGVAWAGVSFAAIAGLGLANDGPASGPPAAYAGAGAAMAGLACLLMLGEGRSTVIPPVVVGAMFLTAGSATCVLPLDLGVVLTTLLTVVVLAGSFVPALALGVTGVMSEASISGERMPVDIQELRADALLAHQIVLAASTSTGLLLLLAAPAAVSLGSSGTLLAVAISLVVMLRTRRHHAGSQVLAGVISGIAGLLSATIAVLFFHPWARPLVAVCLVAAGFIVLALTLVPYTSSVRRDRLSDLVESAALLATLPLLLVATGAVAMIQDRAGSW